MKRNSKPRISRQDRLIIKRNDALRRLYEWTVSAARLESDSHIRWILAHLRNNNPGPGEFNETEALTRDAMIEAYTRVLNERKP